MSSAASIPIGATLINVGNQTIGQFTGIQVGAGLKATPQGSVVMIESTSAAANTAVNQAAWFINAITGDDSWNGQQAVFTNGKRGPLKTFAELVRRWGCCAVLSPGPGLAVTVNIGSDLPPSDPITFDVGLGPSNGLLIKGTNTTVQQSGTFSAVTAKNRATNTPLQGTDAAVNWTNFLCTVLAGSPGRVHDLTNDSYFYPAIDQGGGSARLSEPFKSQVVGNDFPGLGQGDRPGVPVAALDAFTIERLTKVYFGGITVRGSDAGGPFVFRGNNLGFQDLWIAEEGFLNNHADVTGSACALKYYACIIGTSLIGTTQVNGLRVQNCNTGKPFFGTLTLCPPGEIIFLGGIHNAVLVTASGVIFADMDVLFQSCGPGFITGSLIFGTVGVFDAWSFPPFFTIINNPQGDGIHLGPGCSMRNENFNDSTHHIWGSGNVGAGIGVAAGGTFGYASNRPSITGAVADFTVGGKATSRAWNDAGAGSWSALPIANTWATLGLAVPAGLGGAAVDVGTAAKVCLGI